MGEEIGSGKMLLYGNVDTGNKIYDIIKLIQAGCLLLGHETQKRNEVADEMTKTGAQ